MATLELSNLSDHLDDEEIEEINRTLSESGASKVTDSDADGRLIERDLDDDLFVDFADRLDANEAHADIYVPSEFEDVVEIGDRKVGSSYALLTVLDSLREDFSIEDSDDDEDGDDDEEGLDRDELEEGYASDDDEADVKGEQLQHIWRQMRRAAALSIANQLCVFVHE